MSNIRFQFIDQELQKIDSLMRSQSARESIDSQIYEQLKSTLAKVAIANTRDGFIAIPNDDGEVVPIVALKKGDRFRLGPEFSKPTLTQFANIESTVTQWGPTECPADQMVNEIADQQSIQIESIEINAPKSGATTSAPSLITSMGALDRAYNLTNHPSKYLAKFLMRPLIILNLGRSDPDVICHELVHADQKIAEPIRLYSSQHDIEMDKLGDELHAYHAGAMIRKVMNVEKAVWDDPFTQIQAESVRLRYNSELLDPFLPNQSLLSYYRMLGMDDIIDDDLVYENVVKHIENLSSSS